MAILTVLIVKCEEEKAKVIPEAIDTKKYNLYTYTLPYWEGDTVYNESVYPMTAEAGDNEIIQLLYPATNILEVRSSDLQTLYTEGTDYILPEGKIVIPSGCSIKVNNYNDYYLSEDIPGNTQKRLNGGYIYFSEGSTFHDVQIAVTYRHASEWMEPVPARQGRKLPNLQKKIENRKEITVVFFGDSISCSANSSSTVGASPYTPKRCDMFVEALEKNCLKVICINTSVGGQISCYGVENVQSEVICYEPDLVVLGWGITMPLHGPTLQ